MTATNKIINLNVGGTIYTTSLSTLMMSGDCMLGNMFNGKPWTTEDDRGNTFIDRDGQLFRYVLNFLRTSKLVVPDDFREWKQLEEEADFYQIQPLITAINARITHEYQKENGHLIEIVQEDVTNTYMYIENYPGSKPSYGIRHNYVKIKSDMQVLQCLPIAIGYSQSLRKIDYMVMPCAGSIEINILLVDKWKRYDLSQTLLQNGCELLASNMCNETKKEGPSEKEKRDYSSKHVVHSISTIMMDKWKIRDDQLDDIKTAWHRVLTEVTVDKREYDSIFGI